MKGLAMDPYEIINERSFAEIALSNFQTVWCKVCGNPVDVVKDADLEDTRCPECLCI